LFANVFSHSVGCLFVIVRYHLTSVRMAISLEKSTNNKFWSGCGGKGILLHCSWERKLVQPLWRTVWRFLKKKLKIELPYDPAIPCSRPGYGISLLGGGHH